MTILVILADDMTGAADSGGPFASVGLRTVIAFDDAPVADAQVLVRSTDSRGMSARDAARASHQAAQALQLLPVERRPKWVYKKIDSMLRGHPCKELQAVMDGLGEHRALVAPALPEQRRVTVNARQVDEGVPVAALMSTFSCGGEMRVQSLTLPMVRQGTASIAAALQSMEYGFLIADAETDQDLAIIGRAALDSDIQVMAGTAGLARQLAGALAEGEHLTHAMRPPRRGGAILVVAASRNPATTAQTEVLEASCVPVVRPSADLLDHPGAPIGPTVDALATHLSSRRPAVLTTANMAPAGLGPRGVAHKLAAIVSSLAEVCPVDGLVLTGGEVAAEVLAQLGASQLTLGGEVQPAIPWGVLRARLFDGALVVTKAGSFGEPDALRTCVRFLGGPAAE